MASDKDSEYSSGVGRVMWQLLLLIAMVFGVSYYNNSRKNEDNDHNKRSGIVMEIPYATILSGKPLDLYA